LINAFDEFYRSPRISEVYNIGGGRFCNCSMLEAIALCEEIAEKKLDWTYTETNRIGDHIWWISDTGKFEKHFPEWRLRHDLRSILLQIFENNTKRWI
jgi:CDP-paratose 2-epimerase